MGNPNYYSIIPANVRYDNRLTPNAKLLFAEITALTNMNGQCFSTNEYFATLYGVSKVSVSKWIKNLIDCGYLKSEITYKEGTKEIDKRYLTFLNDPIKENFNTPIKEKFKDNNNTTNVVYINNTLTESNNIGPAIEKWVEYKKQKKQTYTPMGLKQCVEKLKKLSGDNLELAMEIVNESMANNYAGLFPLKNQKTKNQTVLEQNIAFLEKAYGEEQC